MARHDRPSSTSSADRHRGSRATGTPRAPRGIPVQGRAVSIRWVGWTRRARRTGRSGRSATPALLGVERDVVVDQPVRSDQLYQSAGLLPPRDGTVSAHVPPSIQRLAARLADVPIGGCSPPTGPWCGGTRCGAPCTATRPRFRSPSGNFARAVIRLTPRCFPSGPSADRTPSKPSRVDAQVNHPARVLARHSHRRLSRYSSESTRLPTATREIADRMRSIRHIQV